jgi:catechol 2,3-dioxygenase-like lactoylglutathione lyase family enzyme
MLGESRVTTTIAVKDVAAAKEFYGTTLGLKQTDESPAGVTYEAGGCSILVYPSEYAGTNKATYAGFKVSDVDAVAADLKVKGVPFQTFEMEGLTWEGDVASMGSFKSAWFTDPDGNIFALDNM